jgi:hypothetical protein
MNRIQIILLLVLICLAPQARGAARPEDLSSSDNVLNALYSVISGPAGAARDWDRFRNLFIPGARLIAVARPNDGPAAARVLSVEDYIARATPAMQTSGFFERELARSEVRYGALLHAFSTYESRHSATEAKPFARGVNSIQLFNDGAQWHIVTVYWDSEGPGRPLPPELLPH